MKYRLTNGEQIFETDLWVMADRKHASGWEFCAPERLAEEDIEDMQDMTMITKRRGRPKKEG